MIFILVLLLIQMFCAKDYYYLPLYEDSRSLGYYAVIYLGNPPKPQALAFDTGSSELFVLCNKCAGCNIPTVFPKYDPKVSMTSSTVLCVRF